MDIAERVEEAILAAAAKKWDLALTIICPALEETARRYHGKTKITGNDYKNFLRSKYDILERFSCTGLNMSATRFPNVKVETDEDKVLSDPDTADIIYHCFRNATAHGHKVSEKFVFSRQENANYVGWNFNFDDGRIHFPVNLVWALIAVVIFTRQNADIVSFSGAWLSLLVDGKEVKFTVGLFWGGEELVRDFFSKHPSPSITMKFSS